jgi:multiple sugar transport system substrate-binding protein
MRHRRTTLVAGVATLAVATAACGIVGGGSEGDTLRVAYQKYGTYVQADQHLKKVKKEFEKKYPDRTVELVPIEAAENDYYTKLNLMQRSSSTAPDVLYEDTFLINSDIQAGYLEPLDPYLEKWQDWDQFADSAKEAARGQDGKIYGVPMGTDTRALWYNKQLFEEAGLPVPWQPKTWDDVLSAARTIKKELPGVIPMNVYSGKPAGEAATMQGFEMLLYGTEHELYDDESKKWIAPSQGFEDSLGFVQTLYQEGLGPSPQQALDPNIPAKVMGEWLPKGELAINLDGSWGPGTWLPSGTDPWPEWSKVLGVTPMPTQNGQAPGATSMSGGWTLAVGSKSETPEQAFEFISMALDRESSLEYDIAASQIPVREDVAAEPEYTKSNPTAAFFSDLVSVTHFRPALPPYPKISNAITVAMESVMTGQQTPEQAMQAYTQELASIVGEDKVTSG